MKKKVYLAAAALAALCLASCNERLGDPKVSEGSPVEVTVTVMGAPGTKATGTTYADESKVNSLQVFVFNVNDREAYRSVSGAMSALVPATSGERTVWAVVNAPDLSDKMTLLELKEALSALKDNARDNFVMTGSNTLELVDGGNVPVTVKRIVARVSVAKISTDLKDYRENYSVAIEGIYMINVAGDTKYEVGGDASVWINKLGHSDADFDSLLYDRVEGVTVSNGHPYEAEHAFYPYPNIHPLEGESIFDAEWSPRGSILVIEATMYEEDGVTAHHGYYPVVLPAIGRNKTYSIEEVCITRLPGDVPYKPIETGETQVTITVEDWELGLNLGTITI
jgi:hypothetical protein